MPNRNKPVVLCILDGWGERNETDHNAIAAAHTPNWDQLRAQYPFTTLSASEGDVGLPKGQMGNSEVGHMNIGAGRIVMQELPRIDRAVADQSLQKNPELLHFIEALKASGGTCHLMGLLSDGGVHSHQTHMAALAEILLQHSIPVVIHAFLDGRDVPPQSAETYIAYLARSTKACIGTVSGRYYAMDRDARWDRIEKAYRAIVLGKGQQAPTAHAAIAQSYAANVTDEFVLPTIIGDYSGMKNGDGVLMVNFRADRARQLLAALLVPEFSSFARGSRIHFAAALGMAEYSEALAAHMPCLFPQENLRDTMGELIAHAGLRQLRIAETEKYAHVTFFFSGGREAPYKGEERVLVPSPKIATYDLKPEMSAHEVTDALVAAIEKDTFDFIVVNYANTDMVGHSGDMNAAIKAVEAVDTCLGRLSHAVLAAGGALLITADHGNAECMHDADEKQPHTAHTLNPVPCLIVSESLKGSRTLTPGILADIAPTLLVLLQLPQPKAMTGRNLLAPGSHVPAV